MAEETQGGKYRALISKSDDAKNQEQVGFAEEEAKQSIEADILATKREIASQNRNVANAKAKVPFNSGAIVAEMDKLEGLSKGLAKLEALKTELF
jgi:hypothetical protein